MSYAPRGPGRPQEPPRDPSNSFSKGSVRAARERLAQAQAQDRVRQNQPEASDTGSLRSQFIPRAYPPPEPQGLPSPQWPLMPATVVDSTPLPAAVAPQDRRLEEYQHPRTAFYPRPGNERPSNVQNLEYLTAPDQRPESSSDTSLGSIPDFPIPDSAPANRRPPVAPAPVAYPSNRRTASSHFIRMSNVSPIPEEPDPRTSVKSYASSNVIPSSDLGFFYEEGDSDDEDPGPQPAPPLVRKASMGKRGKPTVASVKASFATSLDPSVPEEDIRHVEGNRTNSEESLIKRTAQRPSPDAISPSDGSKSAASYENEIDAYLKELETGATEPITSLKQVQRGTLADRVGNRRPPRLNMEATRAAEARASLTSLPDLIRRATKLAANLDRGKTASRLDMDWMLRETGHDLITADIEKDGNRNRRVRSPERRKSMSPRLEWPSGRSSRPMLDSEKFPSRYRQRTICGLNQRSFTGIILLLVLLISAAIAIPIALIVIPKQGSGAQAGTVTTCTPTAPCLNGGTGVLVGNGGCSCVCSDGYTGSTCENTPDSACTTIAIPGISKASIGTEVAPVVLYANANFSIPLQRQALLVQFSTWNMSCTSQNALVTLPHLSKRSLTTEDLDEYDEPPTRGLELVRRQEAVETTNGIVIAAPTTVATAPPGEATVATTAGQPSPVLNASTEAFGKAGVLFVLQDSQSVSLADQAHGKLSDFLNAVGANGSVAVRTAQNVDLGGGYAADLWDWTVTLANGTVYGNGFNGTVTSGGPSRARRLLRRMLAAL